MTEVCSTRILYNSYEYNYICLHLCKRYKLRRIRVFAIRPRKVSKQIQNRTNIHPTIEEKDDSKSILEELLPKAPAWSQNKLKAMPASPDFQGEDTTGTLWPRFGNRHQSPYLETLTKHVSGAHNSQILCKQTFPGLCFSKCLVV